MALETLYEQLAVVATIDPQLVDNNSVTSDWVDMSKARELLFVVQAGATDTTINAKLQAATDNTGTSAADITGKAITQLAASDDNSQALIHIRADEVPAGKSHVALVVTVGDGTTGGYVSAIGLASRLRYSDPGNSLASVVEIVD